MIINQLFLPSKIIQLPGGWMNMQLPVMSYPRGCAHKEAPTTIVVFLLSVELFFPFQSLSCFSSFFPFNPSLVSLPEAFISEVLSMLVIIMSGRHLFFLYQWLENYVNQYKNFHFCKSFQTAQNRLFCTLSEMSSRSYKSEQRE